uniref:Uncharacterized protein n=1 Tax=Taeniopygia guttata TaxID=59729 RepID=A0A674G885_TAEGU
MAYDGAKKKEESHRSVDDGLAPGRIQREKKRSYKDLLQEEDEISTQVETLTGKVQGDQDLILIFLFFPGTEAHKKKRKHSSDEFCYRGKVVIKQKGLTDHDFKERMLLNQCHQALWLAFYRRRVHQPALEQLIRSLTLISTRHQKIRELYFQSILTNSYCRE